MDVSTLYLYALAAAACGVFVSILFSDVIPGVDQIFHPTLILSFVIITSAIGFGLEQLSPLGSILILIISSVIALLVTTLMHIFLFVPMAQAEQSLGFSEQMLEGRSATVIVPIPTEGYGEILLDDVSGRVSKSAVLFEGPALPQGTKVLVIEIKQGVASVVTYPQQWKKEMFT
ncbi:hypothetical protein RCC94_12000 [Exiguobacterium acetylicum]|jgi:membrane protein implicated in regulation of membrane protease activity|uniref:Membrane protein NfeD2 N-terminal transmembrane domain-containing protein n=1 Tax=Salmonella enteritidis PT4 (strain P125109) TaxID=550537 RepID=A0A724WRS1_SALEP|nr:MULTISPECIES: hypothetical protein [Exiguobacterium]HAE0520928.1 hypothetical protein [Salmonella enterica subsp. enterica serovar Enteritidis str. P125109]EZP59304.1 YuaF protein [Exiguobacterium sp. RIT341]KQS37207.1 hypothetical protein ASG02_13330 [Exiguobacterium sp. Leaf196]MDQ6468215.1 hypothetical protein [Exiguobacterium acetylicum]HAB33923.1 hypothetical protein [Exiguobacterium sp.]